MYILYLWSEQTSSNVKNVPKNIRIFNVYGIELARVRILYVYTRIRYIYTYINDTVTHVRTTTFIRYTYRADEFEWSST